MTRPPRRPHYGAAALQDQQPGGASRRVLGWTRSSSRSRTRMWARPAGALLSPCMESASPGGAAATGTAGGAVSEC
jgi:hypothetical protein